MASNFVHVSRLCLIRSSAVMVGYVKSFPRHQSNCGYIVYDENYGTAKNAQQFGIKVL